jgi:hypothetical protein
MMPLVNAGGAITPGQGRSEPIQVQNEVDDPTITTRFSLSISELTADPRHRPCVGRDHRLVVLVELSLLLRFAAAVVADRV